MSIDRLAEIVHQYNGATGDDLMADTLGYCACLAYAFNLPEAAEHFASRAQQYGPGSPSKRPRQLSIPNPGWNFGSGTSGVVE